MQPYTWSREEYYRAYDAGLFEGERVQLIEGTIVIMSPMNRAHWVAQTKTRNRLQALFKPENTVSTAPLALERRSDPEPDVAVVAGTVDDYPTSVPSTALLVVEVSDTTLRFDRRQKASLYAKAGIPEYWILNLNERLLEVHRDPEPGDEGVFGFAYAAVEHVPADGAVSPLAMPEATIAVRDLLP